MNKDIMHFAPSNWDLSTEVGQFEIPAHTAEFKEVEYDLLRAVRQAKRVISLTRYQSVYDFGQFLMRSQIVVIGQSDKSWYKTRRYVAISRHLKDVAIEYNLDHRRLNKSDALVYSSHLDYVSRNDLIFVVKILTTDPKKESIIPYNFTEYYIDYIAEMEYY